MNAAGVALDIRAERVPLDGYIRIVDALTGLGFTVPRA
jgi:hypothetical protein